MNTKVIINCDGIACDQKFEVDAPDSWETSYAEYGGDSSTVFCPDCLPQNEWFRAVCPGCVGGFPDCGLSKAFMYDDSSGLAGSEMKDIESGRCPFRVNGTMIFTPGEGGIESLDISDRAPSASGIAVLNAIQVYVDKYTNENN